jgi:hypothetical protein
MAHDLATSFANIVIVFGLSVSKNEAESLYANGGKGNIN